MAFLNQIMPQITATQKTQNTCASQPVGMHTRKSNSPDQEVITNTNAHHTSQAKDNYGYGLLHIIIRPC
jgi:hypothetical protein